MSVISREVHLVSRPEGMPEPENFSLVETEVGDPGSGEVLVQNLYMSVDPAMRPPLTNGQAKLDHVLGGSAIGRVIASKNESLPEGALVQGRYGFREYYVSDGEGLRAVETEGEPLTTHLHVLGSTGLTAWSGMLIVGKLQEEENVFVSAAAGAVGSVACQIAKIKNCRVAASCGSDDKVAFLKDELGVDYAFNYKTVGSIGRELHIGLPDGIDVYFDNVGGKHLDAACGQMRLWGRIPVCGMISAYNNKGARSEGVTTLSNMVYNRVTMQGFLVSDYNDLRDDFLADMRGWMAAGKLKYRETVNEGIENAAASLIGLLQGDNTGKMLVRLAPE